MGVFIFTEVAMYPRDIRIENPEEALIVEQALAMYREMRRAAGQPRMVRCCRLPKALPWPVAGS